MDDIFAQLANLVSNSSDDSLSAASLSAGSDDEMFEDDGFKVPVIKPKKVDRDKPLIIVIDDDFSTLDLMKIYLQRNYEYLPFDNPKNAIFYLNGNVPDLIFIDCYLYTIKTKKMLEIIRTYAELKNVPIVYIAEPSEMALMHNRMKDDGVSGCISRPVKRGELQAILDEVLPVEPVNQ